MSFFSKRFLKQGAPFLLLVAGAPFIVMQYGQIRYDYRTTGILNQKEHLKVVEVEQARKAGVAVDKNADVVLQEARSRANKEYVNIRGPRPWEDSKEVQSKK